MSLLWPRDEPSSEADGFWDEGGKCWILHESGYFIPVFRVKDEKWNSPYIQDVGLQSPEFVQFNSLNMSLNTTCGLLDRHSALNVFTSKIVNLWKQSSVYMYYLWCTVLTLLAHILWNRKWNSTDSCLPVFHQVKVKHHNLWGLPVKSSVRAYFPGSWTWESSTINWWWLNSQFHSIRGFKMGEEDLLGLLWKNVWNGTAARTRSDTSDFEMWTHFLKWDAAAHRTAEYIHSSTI